MVFFFFFFFINLVKWVNVLPSLFLPIFYQVSNSFPPKFLFTVFPLKFDVWYILLIFSPFEPTERISLHWSSGSRGCLKIELNFLRWKALLDKGFHLWQGSCPFHYILLKNSVWLSENCACIMSLCFENTSYKKIQSILPADQTGQGMLDLVFSWYLESVAQLWEISIHSAMNSNTLT